MESLPLFLLLGLAVVAMLFMSQRSRKQQSKQADFRNTLVPGTNVMTSSGQLGTVAAVEDDAVTIETTPGVYTRWVKAAIQAVPPQFAGAIAGEADEEFADGDYAYDDEDDVTYDDVTEPAGEIEAGDPRRDDTTA